MEENSLPPPPTLSDLALPSWILSRLTEYFNHKEQAGSIKIASSSSPTVTNASLHAFLSTYAKWPCASILIESEALYAQPGVSQAHDDSAHALWRAAAANNALSPDTLQIINEKSSASRVLVSGPEEYPTQIRVALQRDPDLLLIDAVTDKTTFALAEHASFTGHTVLAGMPTLRAAYALSIVMQFSENPALTPYAISFVLASEPIALTSQNAYELIMVTPEMCNLLKGRPAAQEVWDLAKTQGSRTMLDDAREKEKSGVITHTDFEAFERMISQTGLD